MNHAVVLERIVESAIVPAVRTPTRESAIRAVAALLAGGITTMEIPVTVPEVFEIIRELRLNWGEGLIIGAGTVLDAETARAAIVAGAQFIVSPTLNVQVIACCRRYGIPVIPGALTPTEVLAAWEAGADLVKVFPAAALGGPSYLKALRGPLPQVTVLPMGGVTLETAAAYLDAGATALGVGADLVDTAALHAGYDDLLTERAREYLQIVKVFRQSQDEVTPKQ